MLRKLNEQVARLRRGLSDLWWYSGLIFISQRIGDVLNLYTSMFLLPHILTQNELGGVDPIMRLAGFAAIPLGIMNVVGAKYLSTYHATGQYGKIKRFVRDMAMLGLGGSTLFILFLLWAYPALHARIGVDSPHLLLGICLFALISGCLPVLGVMLQGTQRFSISAAAGVVDPVLRLLAALLLLPALRVTGYLLAYVVAGLGVLAISVLAMQSFLGRGVRGEPYYADWRGMGAYARPVAIGVAAGAWLGFIEPFVVRHFLPAADAAGFYISMRFGSIPMFLVSAVNFVVFPILSHRHERGEETQSVLRQTLLATGLVSLAGAAALGLAARWILGLRADWLVYQSYAPQVMRIGVLVVLQSLATIYATHEMACRRFTFLWAVLPVIALETVVLYGSFGWAALGPYLPHGLWQSVNGWIPRTLTYAITVMLIARGITLAGMMIQWRSGREG